MLTGLAVKANRRAVSTSCEQHALQLCECAQTMAEVHRYPPKSQNVKHVSQARARSQVTAPFAAAFFLVAAMHLGKSVAMAGTRAATMHVSVEVVDVCSFAIVEFDARVRCSRIEPYRLSIGDGDRSRAIVSHRKGATTVTISIEENGAPHGYARTTGAISANTDEITVNF